MCQAQYWVFMSFHVISVHSHDEPFNFVDEQGNVRKVGELSTCITLSSTEQ